MSEVLSLTRAARLIGVTRAELQKKIQRGEMISHDGMVTVGNLLACYPDAQLEDTAETRRIALIKERAFGKRVFERALPEPEVLAARITELSTTLAHSQAQVKQFNALLGKLWDKFGEIESRLDSTSRKTMEDLKIWVKQEVEMAMEPGFVNPLAIKDTVLRIMTAQVTVLPSKHDFLVEGPDTVLEAAMRYGIPQKLAPFRQDYRHHQTGETNGDVHLKNLLIGHQVLVPVTNGKLDLGPWQQVYYAEFDGQRRKRVLVKVIGE